MTFSDGFWFGLGLASVVGLIVIAWLTILILVAVFLHRPLWVKRS